MVERAYGEYLEMPGLRLTCAQAQRLWGLDAQMCLSLLEYLVDAKFLHRTGDGAYSRVTDGPIERLRMAKARVCDPICHREEAV